MEFNEYFRQIRFYLCCLCYTTGLVNAGLACLSNPCEHGICLDDINSTYSCYCLDGYTGVLCQTNWDECWSYPCQNGGSCVDGIASYNCTCPDGFVGDNCETNFNECQSNPCENNGTCIDMTNEYFCSCLPGYSGEHCELDIAVCNTNEEIRCYNGGRCIEGPGYKFFCKCLPGWRGAKCEDPIDECESDPCRNGGICIDMQADYMCACNFGYTGKSCETQIEFCDDNSCSNNAICVVEDGQNACYCVPDYHGERCELQYNECLLGPGCKNGGTCIDGVDNYTCSCPPNLTGFYCECLILGDSLDCSYVSPTDYLVPINQTITTTNIPDDIITISYESETTLSYTTISSDKEDRSSNEEITDNVLIVLTTQNNIIPTTEIISNESKEHDVPESIVTKTDCAECLTTEAMLTTVDLEDTTTETVDVTGFTATNAYKTTTPTTITPEIKFTEPTLFETTQNILDESTNVLFTESPTEIIESTLFTTLGSPVYSNDTTTELYNTGDFNDYSKLECAKFCTHGDCVFDGKIYNCQCHENYSGSNCDLSASMKLGAFGAKSFIKHKIQNSTSIQIEFDAKTLMSSGQLMFVDIIKGSYMQLFVETGLLKFKFSCGYQTMLLSELKSFVNSGYSVKLLTRLDLDLPNRHCNATLHVNDTVAMSGGQISSLKNFHRTNLYLGSTFDSVNQQRIDSFVGCIGNLTINGESRSLIADAIQTYEVSNCISLSCLSEPCKNGGSCRELGDTVRCSCSTGWTGDYCEHSICQQNPCQSGGHCLPHPSTGFLCFCPYGRHGIFCEHDVDITIPAFAPIGPTSSYLVFSTTSSAIVSDKIDLRFKFQADNMDQIALLAFIGQNGKHDSKSQHLAVTFVKGYVMLTWNMGDGPRRIFTPRPLTERRSGHTVRVLRKGRSAWLSVDSRFNITGNAPGSNVKMTTLPYIYIGGHKSPGFTDLPHDLSLHRGWQGCIWSLAGTLDTKPIAGVGVGQCQVQQCTSNSCNSPKGVCINTPATYGCVCNEGWFGATCNLRGNPCENNNCQGKCTITSRGSECDCPYGKSGTNCDIDLTPTDILFTGVRSFIKAHRRPISSLSLTLEAEIKPNKARGIIIYTETPHFHTALSLQGGLLEYRWTDYTSGVTSTVRSHVVLSMSQWHHVKAGRYGTRLFVWVDGTINTDSVIAHSYPHTTVNASVFLGGLDDLSSLPINVMTGPVEYFTGCLKNFHINNEIILMETQNIEAGQNIGDCDGTPCGSEMCGSGTCSLQGGIAQCSCQSSSNTTGPRCRRHLTCQRDLCKRPNGQCRRGLCVCNTGFSGDNCENKFKISMPLFKGDSLLSINPKTTKLLVERLKDSGEPVFISFNFTTVTENGLLLFIEMTDVYLSLGIQEGFLKIFSSNKESNFTKLITVYNDFLADAEWHFVAFEMNDKNVNISIDEIAFNSEIDDLFETKGFIILELLLGGFPSDKEKLTKPFLRNFVGCIDNITTRKEGQPITDFENYSSENVHSCHLFPLMI